MRTAAQWLEEYGASHRNPTNEVLHWICVPVIEWCVVGLLWAAPFPFADRAVHPFFNWASVAAFAAILYYACLSRPLALGSLLLLFTMLASVAAIDQRWPGNLWWICLGLFVLAWVGQFIGHAIEGQRPSFFKDLQFLLIGPLWLLSNLYRRAGIPI